MYGRRKLLHSQVSVRVLVRVQSLNIDKSSNSQTLFSPSFPSLHQAWPWFSRYFVDDLSDLIDCMDYGFHQSLSRAMMMRSDAIKQVHICPIAHPRSIVVVIVSLLILIPNNKHCRHESRSSRMLILWRRCWVLWTQGLRRKDNLIFCFVTKLH